jgi:hypothetical protein
MYYKVREFMKALASFERAPDIFQKLILRILPIWSLAAAILI